MTTPTIGLVYSLSAAIDMSLFYPVGVVMDRWGRKWTGVPSIVVFVVGLILLPFSQGFYTLLLAGLVLGLANDKDGDAGSRRALVRRTGWIAGGPVRRQSRPFRRVGDTVGCHGGPGRRDRAVGRRITRYSPRGRSCCMVSGLVVLHNGQLLTR